MGELLRMAIAIEYYNTLSIIIMLCQNYIIIIMLV